MHDLSEIKLRKTLLTLGNSDLVEEINKIVLAELAGVNGKINICFPKIPSQKDKVHFLIEADGKLPPLAAINLKTLIKEKLGFDYTDDDEDYDIIVEAKDFFEQNKIDEFFHDITLFSKENINNVRNFLIKNYPQFFEEEKNTLSKSTNFFKPSSQSSTDQQLVEKFFQSNASEIENVSPREKEESEKTFFKKL